MKKKAALFISILLLILLSNSYHLFPDTRYYKSNDIGMKLKEISEEEINTYEYILLVEETEEMEIRSLYSESEVVKRWEVSFYNNRNVREERTYSGDALESIHYFNRRGRLTEEHLYSDNLFTKKTMYFYRENQELNQTKTFDNKGYLLYDENYEFNRQGMIRQVKRTWNDGSVQVSSFIYGKGQLIEEVYSLDKEMTISHYDDSGNLNRIEVWKEGELLKSKIFFYNKEDGALVSTLEKDITGGIETDSYYNKEGRLNKEIVKKGDVMWFENTYFYDDEGRERSMKKISDRGLEEWSFYYNSEGDLNREEYFNRGVLEKRTIYTDDNSYYEELFRYGELLIRVYYQDDAKVKEEFIDNGEVIRTKSLENEE